MKVEINIIKGNGDVVDRVLLPLHESGTGRHPIGDYTVELRRAHEPPPVKSRIGDIVASARRDIRYFRHKYGDYVSVWGKPVRVGDCDRYDGRMSGAVGTPKAVANYSIRANYLKDECQEVSVKEVPAEWLEALQPREA